MKILILGVNGFIGHHLVNRILAEKPDWQVFGMDLGTERIGAALNNPQFNFLEGDISINKEWIEYHVKKCDVIMPLVAIATPKAYVEDPIGVYNLDFEMNVNIIKQ
ncbi:MAG: bifunctional UDP-4-keto-pentose/UDP-xylose synthase, partial [Candidatus Wallbacteria bacterium HGW-Wallbacteria-1]